MSYSSQLDEMIASHIALYQTELTLTKAMEDQPKTVPIHHGYPDAVYNPRRHTDAPAVKAFIHHNGGHLSNGVPRVISMELMRGYALGAYNPANDDR